MGTFHAEIDPRLRVQSKKSLRVFFLQKLRRFTPVSLRAFVLVRTLERSQIESET